MLWYREVGFTSVFFKILTSKVMLSAIFGLTFFVLAVINLLIVARTIPVYHLGGGPEDPLERYRAGFLPYARTIAIGGSAFLALLFGVGVGQNWEQFQLFTHAVPFGRIDPIFHRDIGFYVFKFPMYQFAYSWLFSSLIVITLAVAAAHYLTGGIRPQSPLERVSPHVKAHLSVLIGLLALVRAWGYRLDQFRLLYSNRGEVTGASYTDVNAHLPALKLLVVISIIAGLLFLVNIRFRGWSLPIAGLGLWLLTSVLAAGAFPLIVQKFTVVPAQLQKETKFIDRNIKATRAAYGLDTIGVTEYPAKSDITPDLVTANAQTIDNIRLFDPEILKTAYKQLQEIRTYYEFDDVDVDRYTIGGKLQQVMLSSRELAIDNLGSTSWVNNHLFYTHGYGAVVSPTNKTSKEGQPSFLVQDIPPKSLVPELEIGQGGIYFGEKSDPSSYSLVKTKQRELDYSSQDSNKFTHYQGTGGVKAAGLLRRLAFAWRFRDVNLLISGLIDKDAKILYYRQIRQRMQKAAPFLSFDGDPYPVITSKGRLVWIADAYTTTNMYPYSESLDFGDRTRTALGFGEPSVPGENNYIRNSVKVTIDAYDGTIDLYQWDKSDPIIRAWRKVFPALFKDASKMPADITEHVRYPEDLFRIQTFLYLRYHVTDPVGFFTREDRWVIPRDPTAPGEGTADTQATEIQPYYVLMKLPGATTEDYVLILPMNPKDRPNMVAYLAAKSGPVDYGKIADFRFPKTRQVFGVGQVHSRINATEKISREISLINQQGSKVQFGNLLVIPIDQSILYVQPLFLQADKNAIPELKFVILATSEQVVLGDSLSDALTQLLQGAGTSLGSKDTTTPATSNKDLPKEALDHLNAAEQALKDGDFATFGREFKAAKEALQRQNGASPSPSPSASASP